MKFVTNVSLAVAFSLLLFGCSNNSQELQDKENNKDEVAVSKEKYERKYIILDSVDEPLPPEAKNVQYMPSKIEPQKIPNADLSDPIVITKMPHSENARP